MSKRGSRQTDKTDKKGPTRQDRDLLPSRLAAASVAAKASIDTYYAYQPQLERSRSSLSPFAYLAPRVIFFMLLLVSCAALSYPITLLCVHCKCTQRMVSEALCYRAGAVHPKPYREQSRSLSWIKEEREALWPRST